jgi:[ribosomal protein S5]-alanine N-acetyltransferase
VNAFPRLETQRLKLRQMVATDADAVFRIFADEAVTRYYDLETFTHAEQAHQLIARQTERFEQEIGIRWGITQKGHDVVIGTCGYMFHRPSLRAELGYDLARPYWRQGIMTEALKAIVDYGFERLDLHRLQALVLPGNIASERLLHKLGFQEEGVLRSYAYFKGAFHDLRCFSRLKQEAAKSADARC